MATVTNEDELASVERTAGAKWVAALKENQRYQVGNRVMRAGSSAQWITKGSEDPNCLDIDA